MLPYHQFNAMRLAQRFQQRKYSLLLKCFAVLPRLLKINIVFEPKTPPPPAPLPATFQNKQNIFSGHQIEIWP